ncbi:MAG: hypothetical protein PHW63_09030, partial [Alphaproteobacteria bacterium]|nr:hypothetical protein [Alphaproteobacteria bacterium]
MSQTVTTRDEALVQILQLMQRYGIGSEDIREGLTTASDKKGGRVQTLLVYLGAALILGGIGTYANMVWGNLASFERVVVSLGSGIVAYVLGTLAISDVRLTRAVTPLLAIGAFLQTGGLFVYLAEYAHGGNFYLGEMAVFGVMAIQLALSFWSKRRTDLGFLAILAFVAFVQAALAYIGMGGEWIAMVLGISGLSIAWGIDKTPYRAMTPFGYFMSSSAIAIASFDILDVSFFTSRTQSYGWLLPLFSVALVGVSVAAKSRTALFVGILHLFFTVGYFTNHYFKDAVGWPLALIAMGFIL